MARLIERVRRLLRRPAPCILMYHRIAEPPHDPWGLCVSRRRFAEQLRSLRRKRTPLPLREFVRRLELGTLPRDAVALTFDDGYADNLHAALPLLEAFDVPATVFLTTAQLGQTRGFWWDELAALVLTRRSALDAAASVGGTTVQIRLEAQVETAGRAWRAWDPPQTERQALYLDLWARLRSLGMDEREVALAALRALFAEAQACARDDLPMTHDEVLRLAASRCIEIGAHTQTHPMLTELHPDASRDEIEASRHACERLIARPVTAFAYPYGDCDAATQALVEQSGFVAACSTHEAAVNVRSFDRFALPRIQVLDIPGSQLLHQLQAQSIQ